MSRSTRPILALCLFFSFVFPAFAEKVADLPAPTSYVNDFAGVLSPATRRDVEDLCTQVDRQAGAQIAVVTIKTLDDGQSIEEFTVELEEKWKVGKKGTDKGLLMLIVLNPKKIRTEVGYGLEGILNDAKVGDIQRTMVPLLHEGNYDAAVPLGVQAYASVIATDAGVSLTPIRHAYRQQSQAAPVGLGIGQIILGVGFVALILIMIATGNGGWLWVIISMLLSGGGRGGGRGGGGFGGGDGEGGGGFGGFGGGSSGGGGASSDY